MAVTVKVGLPAGMVGDPYDAELTAGGGRPPYTWTSSLPLPEGLELNSPSDGQARIHGIPEEPTNSESVTYKITVTDADAGNDTADVGIIINPKLSSPPDGPILQIARCIICISDKISAAYWIYRITKRRWDQDSDFYGFYVLGWLILLTGGLSIAPMSGNWGLAVGSLALYRLQDMLLGTIGDVFAPEPYKGYWASKVAVVLVNIVQVVIIFAITYLVFTTNNAFSPWVPSSRFGHFYLSWTGLLPLGSGFAAKTLWARILAMIESGAGVLLILIALSRFLGKDN
jgi:hypothetical protein